MINRSSTHTFGLLTTPSRCSGDLFNGGDIAAQFRERVGADSKLADDAHPFAAALAELKTELT
jgi:hypothetical protein